MITLKKHVKTGNKEFWEFSAQVEGDDPMDLFMKAAMLDDVASISIAALTTEENKEARNKRIGELKEQMGAIMQQKPVRAPEEVSLEKIQNSLDELLRTVGQFFPKEDLRKDLISTSSDIVLPNPHKKGLVKEESSIDALPPEEEKTDS